jgi:thiol-disulfide isomerase/thioredoxin
VSKSLIAIVILFSFGTVLSPNPPEDLVGPADREAILKHNPDWAGTAAAYQPVPEAIARLRSLGREVRIEVFFGSWCSDCAAHIPAFFKILDMVDSPLIKVGYTGLPRDREKRGPYTGGREIARVPTIIVTVDGRESGRIVETPKKTLEEDLAAILGL